MRFLRTFASLAILSLVVWTAYSDDVSALRGGGQGAVDALYGQMLQAPMEERAALAARLDRVCGQKDCAASRLFWYTDLDEAKAAARRLHRPIVALHLLGRLDEELSCANSRFFRTLLYSDESISGLLRGQYVLYWHSVRPVPRVTIEMGDGRVIRQTITGNSAHYLLDENGEVLDVLPGLYSPAAFRAVLERWVTLQRSLATAAATRRDLVRSYHAAFLPGGTLNERENGAVIARPSAVDASKLVYLKSAVEVPVLRQMQTSAAAVPAADLQPLAQWVAAGEQNQDQVVFSDGAIALIREKQFGAEVPTPDAMRALLDDLRRSVAADTALNETSLRPRIHQWFAAGEVTDLVSLNERVYRELFLTPSDDPWLGLKAPSVFTAIGGQS